MKQVDTDIDKQTCNYLLSEGEIIAIWKFLNGKELFDFQKDVISMIKKMPKEMFQWA